MTQGPWFRERQAWRFILRGYLPWLAALNLVWEVVQLPLYTVGEEAEPRYIAFAVLHCTLGDVLIGVLALVMALTLLSPSALMDWRWAATAGLSAFLAIAYTALSEWMNTSVFLSWAYSEDMPTLALGGIAIGVSPLLQWLVLPPLSLYLARRLVKPAAPRARAG